MPAAWAAGISELATFSSCISASVLPKAEKTEGFLSFVTISLHGPGTTTGLRRGYDANWSDLREIGWFSPLAAALGVAVWPKIQRYHQAIIEAASLTLTHCKDASVPEMPWAS
jgi:hypothetical protein